MDWFYLYFLGLLIVVAAVGLGLDLIGVPPRWIIAVVGLLLGLGVATSVRLARDGDVEDQPWRD